MIRTNRGAVHDGDYHDRLDLAKNVFQVHGIDAVRRQLRRGQMERFFAGLPPRVVGMEIREFPQGQRSATAQTGG
ncbi:MAG: hypothetical protein GEU91_06035 [Rhizobiales bacterium]|nr:hypothetical protein [Hyphomicrobiales bacterium]